MFGQQAIAKFGRQSIGRQSIFILRDDEMFVGEMVFSQMTLNISVQLPPFEPLSTTLASLPNVIKHLIYK